MTITLKGTKRTPAGSRVPTDLLPNAIRYEKARAQIFFALGDTDNAHQATGLAFYYEKRAMDECVLNPGPTQL